MKQLCHSLKCLLLAGNSYIYDSFGSDGVVGEHYSFVSTVVPGILRLEASVALPLDPKDKWERGRTKGKGSGPALTYSTCTDPNSLYTPHCPTYHFSVLFFVTLFVPSRSKRNVRNVGNVN